MCTIAIEALTPFSRTSRVKMHENVARSRLFCRIAKRSIGKGKIRKGKSEICFVQIDLLQMMKYALAILSISLSERNIFRFFPFLIFPHPILLIAEIDLGQSSENLVLKCSLGHR